MNADLVLPYTFEESVDLDAPAAIVFEYVDDFEHFGDHMTRSSWMMAGSSMRYEFDVARGKAVGATVRLIGSVLGAPLQIEECVIERTPPLSKTWETVGHPRMLILEAYRMGFEVLPRGSACRLSVFIEYARPRSGFGLVLGRILGNWYARWCVRSTALAAVRHFGGRAAKGEIVGCVRGPAAPH
jgi:hypothetical protein